MMLKNMLKNKIIQSAFVVGLLLFAGCSASVPVNKSIASIDSECFQDNVLSPTPTPTNTPTPTPTNTPTPTPSPTPTEIPMYDKILTWEESNDIDSEIPVKAALLVNLTDNKVIYSDNATDVIYPASITKLMTAYTIFSESVDLTETVEVSNNATIRLLPDAKMCGFKEGDKILLKDLLGSMLVYSGNDTSVALAEHIYESESEFVAVMNKKAQELGMLSSNFCNTHGLPDDNHVTSAHDIYLIMQKLFYFEEFLGIIELGSINVNVLREDSVKTLNFTSTNKFFSGEYNVPEGITLLGGKTGTTDKAGRCLVVYVQDKDDNCYIAEIFGAASTQALYTSMIQLLTHISDQ